jgi:hypothetical protein
MAVTNYITINGKIHGEVTGAVATGYATDALGSVVATVDNTGSVANTYRYKPYGTTLAKTGAGADPKSQWVGSWGYRFTGRSQSESYVRARHYGQKSGVWTTVDLLWPEQPAYSYSRCMPTILFDPTGRACGVDPVEVIFHPGGPGPCYGASYESWYEFKHPCSNDPCGYTEAKGLVGPNELGFVACCLGKAYACVSKNAKKEDPAVKSCVVEHEKSHIKRNLNCRHVGESGCRGYGPTDRSIGGSYFDFGNDIDECRAYNEEANCLSMALGKLGCKVSEKPAFLGNPNSRRCMQIYNSFVNTCESGKQICRDAGLKMPQCYKWMRKWDSGS